jgi:hypothetical protein
MRDGVCPKCSQREVYVQTSDDGLRALSNKPAAISQFICGVCGYVEHWIQDIGCLAGIRKVSQKISSEKFLGLDD